MEFRRRGALTLLFIFALVTLIGMGGRYAGAPADAHAQSAGSESFNLGLTYGPRHVLAGDRSDPLPADANPELGLNGYCIQPQSSTVTAVGANHGFSVTGGYVEFPSPDSTIGEEPNVWDTDWYDNGTVASNDDYYCIVVRANDGPPADPEIPVMPPLVISWNYEDGGDSFTTQLTVNVVYVTLTGIDGVVGGAGEVCTVGWEPAILTSYVENLDEEDDFQPAIDPLDILVDEDWVISNIQVQILGDPFKKLVTDDILGERSEWCVSVTSPVELSDVGISLRFNAVYDVAIDEDDTPRTPPVVGVLGFHTAGPITIDFTEVSYSEIRHITLGGLINQAQQSGQNVIGARHTACVIASADGDILNPEDITFLPSAGGSAPANVTNLVVFNNPGEPPPADDEALPPVPITPIYPEAPPPSHLQGVPEGTICFSWTSTTSGEQAVYLSFTKVVGQFPGERFVSWDSNGDGNPNEDGDLTGPRNGALVKKWNTLSYTDITLGADPTENIVTNDTAVAPVVFNVSNGSYVFQSGSFRLTEWVYGSHVGPSGSLEAGLLDGVFLAASIDGECGYFASEENQRENLNQITKRASDDPEHPDYNRFVTTPQERRVINGVSNAGRFDRAQYPLGPDGAAPWRYVAEYLHDEAEQTLPAPETVGDGPDDILVSITNDRNCLSGSVITVRIDAYYPDPYGGEPELAHSEYVNIRLEFNVNQKTPTVAWAGEIITIDYGFGTGPGGCGAAGSIVHFIKQADAPGNFLPDGGVIIGNDEARTILGASCSVSIRYESEQQGEVDIEVFLEECIAYNAIYCPDEDLPLPSASGVFLEPNPFTKIAYPVFYLAIEDVTLTATPETVVSTFGDVSAEVRGWFLGANPSSREVTIASDGRILPAGRWVLPDDWELLKGDADLRPGWPGSAPMPSTNVTFFMENEGVVNSFHSKVYHGASGWFELDGSESSINFNPRTGEESILGTPGLPRIITSFTDSGGSASVDTFGDFNLHYEDCEVNEPTGNPLCDLGDIVGQTRYYAIADYPMFFGNNPPVQSNTEQTDWSWAGYKTVTVENSDAASQKYVVVRMRDRDGFCDAVNSNNVLGIPVDFRIDAGGGKIIEAQGHPIAYDSNNEGVVATTFDTTDDQGNPMNVAIVRPIVSSTGDECQAWIKISRSLPGIVNVEITIPPNPAQPVSDVRLTGMQCNGDETFTVTNVGPNEVSLGGWALHGRLRDFGEFAHLGLEGVLGVGESKTFRGGPNASDYGWINNDDTIVRDAPGTPPDYVTLVWQNYVYSVAFCPETLDLQPTFQQFTPFDEELPASGEGELHFSVNVEFGRRVEQRLVPGWNLIGGSTAVVPLGEAIVGHENQITSIYAWDSAAGEWLRYFSGGPDYLNNLTDLEPGVAYWVHAKEAFTLSIPE